MKPKAYHDYLPIYEVSLIYGNSKPSIEKMIKKTFKPKFIDWNAFDELLDEKSCDGCVFPLDLPTNNEVVLCWVMYVKPKANFNVVTHESNHAVSFLFDYIGQPRGDIGMDEVDSYTAGYIAQKFMETIRGAKVVKDPKLK